MLGKFGQKININILIFIVSLIGLPVGAENVNFNTIKLSANSPKTIVKGETGGSYSLSTIANFDRQKNKCLGFSHVTPDRILILEQNLEKLTIQVNSGEDTTLVIKGSGNNIYCGDDTGNSKDASISDQKWKAGTYQIWVGSIDPQIKVKYTLTFKLE